LAVGADDLHLHLHLCIPGYVMLKVCVPMLTCMIQSAASDVNTPTHDMNEGAYKTSIESEAKRMKTTVVDSACNPSRINLHAAHVMLR
jgi:hypothetical protein